MCYNMFMAHYKILYNRKAVFVIVVLACLVAGIVALVFARPLKNFLFPAKKQIYSTEIYVLSIGIYAGENPFELSPSGYADNPVLTAKDVTDIRSDFVADPFMIKKGSTWYMFFEAFNLETEQGDIGLATSADGLHWNYEQIVLDEPFHLSYPYVFKWGDGYYLIPESGEANSVRLYKAEDFPTKWTFEANLLEGNKYVDSSIFYFNNTWWLFTSSGANDTLHLYYADDLFGPWEEHPQSPVVENNANIARPGGRVLVFNNRIIRYTQDDVPLYGNKVRAFEITSLTKTNYSEKPVNGKIVLQASGEGWNAHGMHHIDPHQIEKNKWIACVDGFGDR